MVRASAPKVLEVANAVLGGASIKDASKDAGVTCDDYTSWEGWQRLVRYHVAKLRSAEAAEAEAGTTKHYSPPPAPEGTAQGRKGLKQQGKVVIFAVPLTLAQTHHITLLVNPPPHTPRANQRDRAGP